MKLIKCWLILSAVFMSSCSRSLYTSLYDDSGKNQGISYNLPKNILKVEITYTINEPRVIANGVDKPLDPKKVEITIDDPIVVSSLLVADKLRTYLITNDQVSNKFFLKSDIDIKLSDHGLLSSIESDIEDNSIDFAENLVVSTAKIVKNIVTPTSSLANIGPGGEAFEDIRTIQQSIINITKKEDLELALKKIEFYKEQIDWYNKNFKNYIKKSQLKYTVTIDPTEIYNKKGSWSENVDGKIQHNIFPKHIFPNNSILNDTITVELPNINPTSDVVLNEGDLIKGIVYRTSSNVNIDITSNGNLLAANSMYLAQFGKASIVPVDSKRGGKKKTSLVFSSTTGGLTNQKVEAGNSSEILSKSIKNTVETLNETVEYLKFEGESKKLEKQKSIKELKDALKESEKEVKEPETEFEKQVREAKEKQQLLELELLIKQLKKQIEELETTE